MPGHFEQQTGIVKSTVVVAIGCGPGLEDVADVIFDGDPAVLVDAL